MVTKLQIIAKTLLVEKIALSINFSAIFQKLAFHKVIIIPSMPTFLLDSKRKHFLADKKCDGIVHCIEGEDESFETCKDEYPEEATIKCIEDRAIGYDIVIMATPCDGVKECRNGSDERCEEDKMILIGIVAGLVILTGGVYHYLKWYHLGWKDKIINEPSGNQRGTCSTLMGDDLAKLKVSQIKLLLESIDLNIITTVNI